MSASDPDPDSGFDPAPQPHDAYFKSVFSRPEHAAGLLQPRLPPALSARIDWDSLVLLPGSFVDSSLRQIHSDLLFSATIAAPAPGEQARAVLLYLLLEHQTSVDPVMPLRLLNYITGILNEHHKEHGLPLLVLHQGPDRWSVSTDFADLFDLSAGLKPALLPYLPCFSHGLLDLGRADPAAEEARLRLRVVLQVMKMVRRREALAYFAWLADELSTFAARAALPEAELLGVLHYLLHSDGHLDAGEIARIIEHNPDLKKTTMSLAEKLIAQGAALGRAEGETRGEARGKVQGEWIGRIRLLEELSGLEVTPKEILEQMDEAGLDAKFQVLQREYTVRFKRRP